MSSASLSRVKFVASFFAILSSLAPRGAHAQGGDVHGRISAAGASVVGARVSIEIPPRVSITDERGAYTLRGIPAGHYDVVTTALGYKSAKRGIDVSPNESATLDVSLQQGP